MRDPKVVKVNPNRANIYLKKEQRSGTPGNNGYEEILKPIALQLKKDRDRYPLTLVYFSKIRLCGFAYGVFEKILDEEQYVDGMELPSFRLFNQFHASQTDTMKMEILREVVKDNSKLRVLFATSALGMGVDIPHVETVIHIGAPSTFESYLQQIGRAGRNSKQANAILYWNNADIGNNITHMSEEMRRYCRSAECLRRQLIGHFGFSIVKQDRCCSNCDETNLCQDVCKKMSQMDLPAHIVRRAAMSRPLLIRELSCIITRWQPNPAITNMFQVEPLPDEICEKIADDIQFITGVSYLSDNFEIWDSELAQQIFQCIVKHTSV